MNEDAWERVAMERVQYEPGEDEDRFVVLVVTKRYGGDAVSPLYEKQARRLVKQERDAGHLTMLIRFGRDGQRVVESDF
jgi:hypothetical protein